MLKDNLTIAYEKVSIFIRPLYMALSYEKTQGPLHSPLAQVLSEIHTNVNASSVMLSRKVSKTTRFVFANLATTIRKNNHEYFFPNLVAPFLVIADVNISSNVSSTGNSTAQMNQTIRVYLQALANNNLLVSYPFI